MRKSYTLATLFILFLFINGPKFILAKTEGEPSFGVNIGDRFKLLVTDMPNPPSASEGGDPPAGVNFTALFNLNLDNFTLRPIIDPLPSIGTPISLNITKLANNSSFGNIRYNVSQNYTDIASNFILGEPVVSNNWERWIEVINTMEAKKIIDDKAITVVHLELNESYFTSILLFKPKIPDSISFMVSKFEIEQTLRYFVTSGIRDLIKVEITVSVLFFGTSVSTTSLEFISDSYDNFERFSTTSTNSSPDLFPFLLLPVIIFVPLGFILLFKRFNKSILPKK